MRYQTLAVWSLVLLLAGLTALAQEAPGPKAQPAPTAVPAKPNDPGRVTEQLRSNDNFLTEWAMPIAVAMLQDPKAAKGAMTEMPTWLKVLSSQRRLDEVEDLALAGICANPSDLKFVESCQEYRVRAKLIAGKPQEALALAKGLYNVCAMPNTSHAIDVICECLYDANKESDPVGAVKRFKLQQVQGAAATQPAADKSMLAEIKVDPKPYKDAISAAELNVDGFAGMMAKGNLLLLTDQTKEAKAVFEKAYTLASDQNLATATESMARTMRAEDGSVGRANAWILSLRPEGQ